MSRQRDQAGAWLLLAAVAEAALTLVDSSPVGTGLSFLAACGLLLRTRAPWLSVLLALPGLVFGCASVAAVVGVYSLAVRPTPRWLLGGAIGATFAANAVGALGNPQQLHPVALTMTAAMFALAPAAVGILVATRRKLVLSLAELEQAHEAQRQKAATEAVRHERELLAREMHDVVSHQVSLMAVQAGALQVSATDANVRTGAKTIRALCVATLEELRTMLTVLRAGDGGIPEIAPQPSLADLPALLAASELDASLELSLPEDLSAPVQRAVFRSVQESLTNVRKHAPGASVRVSGSIRDGFVEVRVRNDSPKEPALALPGSGLGLVGLAERAQVLGGSAQSAATLDGGYETVVRIPAP
ncbi:sensor histidine kinase [Leucobacter sp. BZR 635]